MADRPWWKPRNAPPDDYVPPQQPPQPRQKPRLPPQGENRGDQQWWQDRRVPRSWQDQTEQSQPQPPPRPQNGRDATSAYDGASPQESEQMLRGAFFAGMNGDTGAINSFPNTPFGRRLRQEFERGWQAKQRNGLGFADRGG